MSRIRLSGLAITGAALLIAGAWGVTTHTSPATPSPDEMPAAAHAALGSPSPSPAAPPGAARAAESDSTTPNRTKPKKTHPSRTVDPFVQTFAAQPGVKPLPPRKSPQTPMPVDITVDGCDHNYGTRTQCIPWAFPDGVTDKCAWLAQHGYQNLSVTGTDRQKLDKNRNKVACDG